ncbi:MAG: ABC transporter permease [Gemmatimonadaceae bacterium]|nr:ABC transporter permease [Gemmatimonadaceae bacterium]
MGTTGAPPSRGSGYLTDASTRPGSGSRRYSALVELTRVRFLEFLREPEAVFWTFVFPILLATGLGVAFRSRPAEVVPVAVVAGAYAERVRVALDGDSLLNVSVLSDSAATEALRLGTVAVVVAASSEASVEYRFDDARPEARNAGLLVDRAIQRAGGGTHPVATRETLVSEPGSRYVDFVVPGLLAMNLMGSGIWGIGFAIVDARRKKLLKRLVATPMRKGHYLASFLFMRLGLMIIEVTVISAFGHFAFGVPMRGSLLVFIVVALFGTLAFGALGLLIAARAKTIEAASGMMNLVMLPMWVASGVFFASSRFPEVVQPFVQALPLTAAVDALRFNMLQGQGFAGVGSELAILGAWLLVAFTLAMRLFRWR